MGTMNPENASIAKDVYKRILSTFSSLQSIHGFLYYLVYLGALISVTYTAPAAKISSKHPDQTIETNGNVIEEIMGANSQFLIDVLSLRNCLVHWNYRRIKSCWESVLYQWKLFDIKSIEDDELRNYIGILMSADWEYMKSEIHRLCPDITF